MLGPARRVCAAAEGEVASMGLEDGRCQLLMVRRAALVPSSPALPCPEPHPSFSLERCV